MAHCASELSPGAVPAASRQRRSAPRRALVAAPRVAQCALRASRLTRRRARGCAACALGLQRARQANGAPPYPDWAGLPEGLLLQMFEIMTHLEDGRDLVRPARRRARLPAVAQLGAATVRVCLPRALRPAAARSRRRATTTRHAALLRARPAARGSRRARFSFAAHPHNNTPCLLGVHRRPRVSQLASVCARGAATRHCHVAAQTVRGGRLSASHACGRCQAARDVRPRS